MKDTAVPFNLQHFHFLCVPWVPAVKKDDCVILVKEEDSNGAVPACVPMLPEA